MSTYAPPSTPTPPSILTMADTPLDPVEEAWEDIQTRLEHRPELPTLMTAAEVASFLGLHVSTVKGMAKRGQLAGLKVGPTEHNAQWRFRRADILAYLEGNAYRVGQGCGCTGELPDAPSLPPA